MLIKELALDKFLSYGTKETLPLGNLNVFIGTNGAGKSNFIEAIDLIHNAPSALIRPIRDGGGVSDWLWKETDGSVPVATIEAVFSHRDRNGMERDLRYMLCFSAQNQRFEIIDERVEDAQPFGGYDSPYFYYHFNSGRPYLNVWDTRRELRMEDVDFESSILAQRKDPDQYPEITWLGKCLDAICIYRDWNFGRYTAPRRPQPPDLPNQYLASDCSNLGLVLNKYALSAAKKRILDIVKDINPTVEDYTVQIEGGTVQLFVREEGGMTIPATRLSDGTLRFFCLAAVLCNPNPPPLICIEEPELGLHPDALSSLAELLKEASQKTQVIVTTHSAMLIDYLTDMPESVVVTEKDEDGTHFSRLDKEKLRPWLKEYRLGHLWMQGDFGGTRW